ncbi:hypothetical protein BpHYR1_035356 [Brachionus plicatilis]|uniref:Uncharacterized protein n=1 Tax=Brachionus plicatilis TaxID=10195 RepID=A0A3M7PPG3_BRAPC|nr:hypothetical protein BpHYR1_035356 [Brachionus plicatilis]
MEASHASLCLSSSTLFSLGGRGTSVVGRRPLIIAGHGRYRAHNIGQNIGQTGHGGAGLHRLEERGRRSLGYQAVLEQNCERVDYFLGGGRAVAGVAQRILQVVRRHVVGAAAVDDQQGEIVQAGQIVGHRAYVIGAGGQRLLAEVLGRRLAPKVGIVQIGHTVVQWVVGYFVNHNVQRFEPLVMRALDGHCSLGQVGCLGRYLDEGARVLLDLFDKGAALADQEAGRVVRNDQLDQVESVVQVGLVALLILAFFVDFFAYQTEGLEDGVDGSDDEANSFVCVRIVVVCFGHFDADIGVVLNLGDAVAAPADYAAGDRRRNQKFDVHFAGPGGRVGPFGGVARVVVRLALAGVLARARLDMRLVSAGRLQFWLRFCLTHRPNRVSMEEKRWPTRHWREVFTEEKKISKSKNLKKFSFKKNFLILRFFFLLSKINFQYLEAVV